MQTQPGEARDGLPLQTLARPPQGTHSGAAIPGDSARRLRFRRMGWGLSVVGCLAAAGVWRLNAQAPVAADATTQDKLGAHLTVGAVGGLAKVLPISDVITVGLPYAAGDARVAAILVREGDVVQQNQVLATLDNQAQAQASLSSAMATLKAREAALSQVKAQTRSSREEAQAALQRAILTERVAASEWARWQGLVQQDFVSPSGLDQKRVAWEQSDQEVLKARAALLRFGEPTDAESPDVVVARTNLQIARADVARLEAELLRSEVRAPQPGQVLTLNVRAGERVGASGLMTMGDTRRMRLDIEVHQSHIGRVRVGDKVTAVMEPTHEQLEGVVSLVGLEIARQTLIDTSPAANADARVFKVRAILDDASSERARRLTNFQLMARIQPDRP